METIARTENNAQNLTDLECSIVEAQAFDRYKRYLKAAREVDKYIGKIPNDEEVEPHQESLFLIHDKYDIPRIKHFFGEEMWDCKCVVSQHSNLDFQTVKHWISAAAFGKMTEEQFNHWIFTCEFFDYMDPYWIMLGIPLWWTDDLTRDPMDEIGGYKSVENVMKVLCTRSKKKKGKLPVIGYSDQSGCTHI